MVRLLGLCVSLVATALGAAGRVRISAWGKSFFFFFIWIHGLGKISDCQIAPPLNDDESHIAKGEKKLQYALVRSRNRFFLVYASEPPALVFLLAQIHSLPWFPALFSAWLCCWSMDVRSQLLSSLVHLMSGLGDVILRVP